MAKNIHDVVDKVLHKIPTLHRFTNTELDAAERVAKLLLNVSNLNPTDLEVIDWIAKKGYDDVPLELI